MLSGRPALTGEALGTEGHADVVCCGREDSERIREVRCADLTCGRVVSGELDLQAGGPFERSAGPCARQQQRVELGDSDGKSVLVAQVSKLVGKHGL